MKSIGVFVLNTALCYVYEHRSECMATGIRYSGINGEVDKLHSPAPFSPEKQFPLTVRYQTG